MLLKIVLCYILSTFWKLVKITIFSTLFFCLFLHFLQLTLISTSILNVYIFKVLGFFFNFDHFTKLWSWNWGQLKEMWEILRKKKCWKNFTLTTLLHLNLAREKAAFSPEKAESPRSIVHSNFNRLTVNLPWGTQSDGFVATEKLFYFVSQ